MGHCLDWLDPSLLMRGVATLQLTMDEYVALQVIQLVDDHG
jgi:hypothetical protein